MKKNTQIARFAPLALIVIVTTAFVFATAVTAYAEEGTLGVIGQMQVVETVQGPLVLDEILGYAEALEPQPEAQGPFPDGGDWEMVPQEEPQLIPDGGFDEMVPDEEPLDEGEENDVPEEQQGQQDVPEASQEQTPTDVPQQPDDEPSLPFTGGDATPYAIGGLLMALAGVAVLITQRKAFAR